MRRLTAAATVLAASLALAGGAAGHEADHVGAAREGERADRDRPERRRARGEVEARDDVPDREPAHGPRLLHVGRRDVRVRRHARGRPERGRPDDRPADPAGRGGAADRREPPLGLCVSNPAAALGLQHDVEATPKGNAILNTANPAAVRTDAQLLLDATDASGRCHDQGTAGVSGAPRGGLELVDITNVVDPVEIGLTSHIGEAHTVNVDPKRPHIAYAVTSDSIAVSGGKRQNEVPGSSDRNDLDGFEVVDLSSCMNFPAGTSADLKRMLCKPQVYRYRYPTAEMALGHSLKSSIYGCHELEVYPDDRLTCGSGAAMLLFDMKGAFDDRGTPTDYTDDRPRGVPLDCDVRPSSSAGPWITGAFVTDCTRSKQGTSLDVPTWLASGAPSLEGVAFLGAAHHQGRGGPFPATEDNDFDHEAELSESREADPDDGRAGRRRHAARRDVLAGSGTGERERRHPRLRRRPARPVADLDADARAGVGGLRPHAGGRQGDLPGADPDAAGGDLLHRPRVPADPGPEPDLHGLVLAGHAGRRLRRACRRHRLVRGGGLVHPRERQHVDVRRVQDARERRRHVHLLGRHRRLQPRRRRSLGDRRVRGDAAGARRCRGADAEEAPARPPGRTAARGGPARLGRHERRHGPREASARSTSGRSGRACRGGADGRAGRVGGAPARRSGRAGSATTSATAASRSSTATASPPQRCDASSPGRGAIPSRWSSRRDPSSAPGSCSPLGREAHAAGRSRPTPSPASAMTGASGPGVTAARRAAPGARGRVADRDAPADRLRRLGAGSASGRDPGRPGRVVRTLGNYTVAGRQQLVLAWNGRGTDGERLRAGRYAVVTARTDARAGLSRSVPARLSPLAAAWREA